MILRDFMFAMIIITVVTVGFSQFWGSLAQNYGVEIPEDDVAVLQMYNLSSSVNSITYQLQGNTTGIANVIQNIPILGSFASLLIAGVQAIIIMVTQVPPIFMSMLSNLSGLSGGFIPAWFIGLIGAAITLAILWAIISQAIVKGRI